MKRFTVLIMILLVSISSCKKEPEKIDCTWTGQTDKWDIASLVPACIIWYKKVPPPLSAWRPYKSFSQTDANEMRNIILELIKPEEKETNIDLKTEDKLSLIFYNGFPAKLTVREVYFNIENQTFIGPTGRSNKLGQILLGKQEIDKHFYYPYSELGSDHYLGDFPRIIEILKSQEKTVEKYKGKYRDSEKMKSKKEAEPQEKIEEAK